MALFVLSENPAISAQLGGVSVKGAPASSNTWRTCVRRRSAHAILQRLSPSFVCRHSAGTALCAKPFHMPYRIESDEITHRHRLGDDITLDRIDPHLFEIFEGWKILNAFGDNA